MSFTAAACGFVVFLLSVPVGQGQYVSGLTYTPTEICAFRGSTVDIDCNYNDQHPDNIREASWFIKKTESEFVNLEPGPNSDGRVEFHDDRPYKTLTIKDLRESDSADYVCEFTTNQQGRESSGVTLKITDPDLQVQVIRSSVYQYQAELECVSNCPLAGGVSYVWYRNEEKIREGNVTYYEVKIYLGNSYSCAVKGHESFRSPSVYDPKIPSVSVRPSGEIVEGSSVTLTCSSDANPAATYTWYKKNGNPSQEPFRTGLLLDFISIQSSDSGEFYCTAQNELGGKRSDYISIDVKHAPKVPSVSVSPSGEIVEGSSVTLTCSSDANPAANYTWYKKNGNPDQEAFRTGPQLDFVSIQSSDSGEFSCTAQNELGENTSDSTSTDVKYAPKVPSVSVRPSGEIVEGSSVNLTCSSDANPAANYTWYKKNGNPDQEPLRTGPQLDFVSIQSSDSGEVYCTVQNELGEKTSDSTSIDVKSQCQEHGGDTRRQASTPGEMEGAVGGQQPSSRTAICFFVQGGRGGALAEPSKITSSRPLVCMFLPKLSETDSMRWHEGLTSSNESRFTLSTYDRRDRVWQRWGEHYAAYNLLQDDRFGGGSVMVWGGISLDGCTDLHVLARGAGSRDLNKAQDQWPYAEIAEMNAFSILVLPGSLLISDTSIGSCKDKKQSDATKGPLGGTDNTIPDRKVKVIRSSIHQSSIRAELKCHTLCRLAGRPSYVWYRNGEQKRFSSSYTDYIYSEDSYYCAVRGRERFRSPSVYAPKVPSVSVRPSGEIVEGSSVTLTCSSDANPAATYTWYKKNGNPDQEPFRTGPQLDFVSIQSSDSGEFYCTAQNELGAKRSDFTSIDVKYGPRIPSVSVSPSGEIVEGSSLNLTCSTDANPAANYTWYKKNETSPKALGPTFTITNITSEHSGEYYCEAQNRRGRHNSKLQLTVVEDPSAGKEMKHANAVRATLLILKPIALFVLYLCIRKKKSPNSEQSNPGQAVQSDSDPVYVTVTAAQTEATEEQEDQV
ncbi:B-cell receptor CD22-like [Myripristis murdjan]|uniref:B-cell receptor CD22-like n=1 Tax=Myripristis murdjan TaxID=586833 RepID=UPI0011761840|nr:B-cell receptor CD22-like [Myripristis murdjan]